MSPTLRAGTTLAECGSALPPTQLRHAAIDMDGRGREARAGEAIRKAIRPAVGAAKTTAGPPRQKGWETSPRRHRSARHRGVRGRAGNRSQSQRERALASFVLAGSTSSSPPTSPREGSTSTQVDCWGGHIGHGVWLPPAMVVQFVPTCPSSAGVRGRMGHAPCSPRARGPVGYFDSRSRSSPAACAAPACIGLHRAELSRSREKAPETPISNLAPNAKPLTRRLCPMHETRRPTFRWWRGFTTIGRPSPSRPTNPLVRDPAPCSRLGGCPIQH
jgi:hypothetical protein